MNFKFMPELNWHWGYLLAIASMAIATILPLSWFKRRGWW
jgi:magnesium transporter